MNALYTIIHEWNNFFTFQTNKQTNKKIIIHYTHSPITYPYVLVTTGGRGSVSKVVNYLRLKKRWPFYRWPLIFYRFICKLRILGQNSARNFYKIWAKTGPWSPARLTTLYLLLLNEIQYNFVCIFLRQN